MRLMMNLCVAAALLAGSPAFAHMTMGGAKATADGLNDAAGKPLYTFARDTMPGKSACNGPCATAWPSHRCANTRPSTVARPIGTSSTSDRSRCRAPGC